MTMQREKLARIAFLLLLHIRVTETARSYVFMLESGEDFDLA